MKVLKKPLSLREIKKAKNKIVSGVVGIYLTDIINGELDTLLDDMSEKLIGSQLLMDIHYEVVGGKKGMVIFKVSGDVSAHLKCLGGEK